MIAVGDDRPPWRNVLTTRMQSYRCLQHDALGSLPIRWHPIIRFAPVCVGWVQEAAALQAQFEESSALERRNADAELAAWHASEAQQVAADTLLLQDADARLREAS